MIGRRKLFGVLAGAIAAPVVVRSGLLMPVSTAPFKFNTEQSHLIDYRGEYRVVAVATVYEGQSVVVFEDAPSTLNFFTGNFGFEVGQRLLVT